MDASTDRRETDSAGVSIPGWRPPCGSTQGLHPSVDGSPRARSTRGHRAGRPRAHVRRRRSAHAPTGKT